MRIFETTIEGTSPILFDNPSKMDLGPKVKKPSDKALSAQEQAEQSCYWLPDKSSLAFPGDNIHASLKTVSTGYKYSGRKSVKPFVCGSVQVVPDEIPFGTKEFTIDTRRAVNRATHGAIMRSRAKLREWKLTFRLLVDEDFPVEDAGTVLRQILEEAGRRTGIGSFRPECSGRFGKFTVLRFVEVKSKGK